MKKFFILPAAFLFVGMALNAQDAALNAAKSTMAVKDARKERREAERELRSQQTDQVSVMVKDRFYQDFGELHPSWRKTTYFDEASFVQNGKVMTAYYDWNADLAGTTTPAAFSDIPASAQRNILKHYKGYATKSVILFDDNQTNQSDALLFGTAVSGQDNYFVELQKGNKTVILKVTMDGLVSYFSERTSK